MKVPPLPFLLTPPAVLGGLLLLGAAPGLSAEPGPAQELTPAERHLLEGQGLHWRCIGPWRGGRVTAVCGVRARPDTYYMGATGGGVWKSEDAGTTWNNVSDGHLRTVGIGAIEVAESDPQVVWVGTGEAPVRGVTTTHGDGVYRSTDGGRTWQHRGLELSRHISRIRVDPRDPDRAYVAAQGALWSDSDQRGVYRTLDGGESWEHVLVGGPSTGASDLVLEPGNPRVLYAALWDHRRSPWQVRSGGPGSGLWKSTDGGERWQELSSGLPETMGKIGVAVSPARPQRVWALVEAEEGGLFRSDDGGARFQRVNSDRLLRARAWYYTHVFAHPRDADGVYVLNAPMLESVDGGVGFRSIATPHGDNHALWIHPDHPERMINGNDGGANVSLNGGRSWSTQSNQPTGQFYRVIADQRFPVHVYGGQQDNSTVCIATRTEGGGITESDWYPVGGCESAYVAMDPRDPRFVYAGCYQGIITEYDHATGRARDVMAYPYLGLGSNAADQRYRFHWNAPIRVSAHDPEVIYHGAQRVLRSRDRGVHWEEISPDLSFADPRHLGPGGTPITNEAAGAENYHTLLCLEESPHAAGTLWAGSDDGRVHVTRDGGEHWEEVTPYDLGVCSINAIEISPHEPETVILAVMRDKQGDLHPYVYRSEDGGRRWEVRVEGLVDDHPVRVVREDPVRPGLLYAGTEGGLSLSFDAGRHWHRWQADLPVVPITDLCVAGSDLVASTQGRAFWMMDDLSALREAQQPGPAPVRLFPPRPACRWGGGGGARPGVGENAPAGALLHYDVSSRPEEGLRVELSVHDARGRLLRRWRPADRRGPFEDEATEEAAALDPRPLVLEEGLHRFVWDLRVHPIAEVPGQFHFGGRHGPRVAPGEVVVRLRVGDEVQEHPLQVFEHPAEDASPAEWAAQQELLGRLHEAADRVHRRVQQLRATREQLRQWTTRVEGRAGHEEIRSGAEAAIAALDALEDRWIQPRQQTFQDVINFPNRLNAHLIHLMGMVDGRGAPITEGAQERFADLQTQVEEAEAEWARLRAGELAAFEALLVEHRVPRLVIPDDGRD